MASIGIPFASFPVGPRLSRERPITFALVGSGIVHALLAIVITMRLVTLPDPRPVGTSPDVRAVLQYTTLPEPPPLPDPIERIAMPTLAPLIVPLLPPEPPPSDTASARTAPVAPPSASPAAAMARIEPRALDPNGSVTVGVLTDAQRVGPAVAAMTDRYRTRPDRAPRLTAALIVPYPTAARRSRTSARITAVLDIDEGGRIAGTHLVPDDATFAPAVVEALKDARFTPAEVATHPVPYWAVLEFDFAISAR